MKWPSLNLWGTKQQPEEKAVSIPAPNRGQFQMVNNGQIVFVPDTFNSYVVNGYQANDIIYSIINMIMDKIRVAPWGLYKVQDEAELKRYHSFMQQKDWKSAAIARKAALVPLENFNNKAIKLLDLLKYPNEWETWQDFIANGCGFKLITGNKYVWANMLQAGANQGLPQELVNAPAQHMMIKATNGWPQRVTGYQMMIPVMQNFTREQIMHEKLFNPDSTASGAGLYGQSPIKAALKTLTRNTAAKKGGAKQLDNAGPPGIAFVDDALVPVSGRTDQATAIQNALAKGYSGADNRGKIPISGFKMGYVSIGSTLKEMELTEIEMLDLRILCNVWGVPSELLNDSAASTYNNVSEAEKALTSRCALPYLTSARDNFNRKFQSDWGFKGENIYADFDMSVYSELMDDQSTKWSWVSKLPASNNYKMQIMGLDPEKAEGMDVVMVDGSLVPLADVINSMGLTDDQAQATVDELNKAGIYDYLKVAK